MTDGSLFNLNDIPAPTMRLASNEELARMFQDDNEQPSTAYRRPALCVRSHDRSGPVSCAICGHEGIPDGFDVFVDGTDAIVCDRCGWHFEPALMRACNEARNALQELARYLTRSPR